MTTALLNKPISQYTPEDWAAAQPYAQALYHQLAKR
jgi:hypothetical protein